MTKYADSQELRELFQRVSVGMEPPTMIVTVGNKGAAQIFRYRLAYRELPFNHWVRMSHGHEYRHGDEYRPITSPNLDDFTTTLRKTRPRHIVIHDAESTGGGALVGGFERVGRAAKRVGIPMDNIIHTVGGTDEARFAEYACYPEGQGYESREEFLRQKKPNSYREFAELGLLRDRRGESRLQILPNFSLVYGKGPMRLEVSTALFEIGPRVPDILRALIGGK